MRKINSGGASFFSSDASLSSSFCNRARGIEFSSATRGHLSNPDVLLPQEQAAGGQAKLVRANKAELQKKAAAVPGQTDACDATAEQARQRPWFERCDSKTTSQNFFSATVNNL